MIAIYITGNTPTILKAQVEDRSCLREGCHNKTRLSREEVDFTKDITFSHEVHFEPLRNEIKLRCTSCHSQIVQGEHITVAELTCFTCHFKGQEPNKKTARCILCHGALGKTQEAETKFNHQAILQMGVECLSCHKGAVEGEGEIAWEKCLSCHAEPSRLERISETSFLHLEHVSEHKVECFQCHSQIKHGVEKWPLSFP
jgi:hypothetical protein